MSNKQFDVFKAVDKIENLEKKVKKTYQPLENDVVNVGIGHTRWATHGKPTEINAHPHLGEYSYVVHNGIIENYKELKKELIDNGHIFVSQTDTEVIVHLFENFNNILNNPTEAFKKTIERLEGAFAILLVTKADSSMTRIADYTLLTRAGIEKGVASTKAFSTQTIILWMLALYIAKINQKISIEIMQKELHAIREVPKALCVSNAIHEKAKRLAKRYLHGHGFFFIGRDVFYPLALEGALKLKEISYLHAEGYPAGEMKHGPIALADSELFTVALMPQNLLYDKITQLSHIKPNSF